MKRTVLLAFLGMALLLLPVTGQAAWKQLEGPIYENAFGTIYFYEPKMHYADGSSRQNPLVDCWGKTVFKGKSDPLYQRIVSSGGSAETVAIEIKYRVDLNKKQVALMYGILYDLQGRVLSTDEVKKPEYLTIPAGSAAEETWRRIKEMHEAGAIAP